MSGPRPGRTAWTLDEQIALIKEVMRPAIKANADIHKPRDNAANLSQLYQLARGDQRFLTFLCTCAETTHEELARKRQGLAFGSRSKSRFPLGVQLVERLDRARRAHLGA